MDLKNQKRMAAEVLKCGENRVWIDPNRIEDVADAITRADIRTAIQSGSIRALPVRGVSRGRARHRSAQKAKGRRRGQGSRKGTSTARRPKKESLDPNDPALRATLRGLRDEGKISPKVYREFYMKAKGGMFRSRNNLLMHLKTEGYLKEDN